MMDVTVGQGPGGAVMSLLPPTPVGVSFMIQIGLTRESVFMPQNADLAYVKQIACSIVDTKVGSVSHAAHAEKCDVCLSTCLDHPPPFFSSWCFPMFTLLLYECV